jgi:phage portal protein BeeE
MTTAAVLRPRRRVAGRSVPAGPVTAGQSSRIVFPPAGGGGVGAGWGFGPMVWDAWSARRIPGVGRALDIYSGMLKQAPLDAWRGVTALPRPRLLDRPDPDNARSWFVQVNVEDYLLNGNAMGVVTARGSDGWPLTMTWIPAQWCYVQWTPGQAKTYWAGGKQLPTADVVHVKRGADRFYPVRGVGVVEQYLTSLDRVAREEEYERSALSDGAVPSVAVITPNPMLGDDEVIQAKADWLDKFGGGKREPAILPNGTQVIPLGWSPSDNQMIEARKMSLQDVANMFNLDGYWVGAAAPSLTYRSPGPMYLNLLRTSINPVASDFEDVWSDAWLPRGTRVRFDREMLLRDDMETTVQTLVAASGGPFMSREEARQYMALPVVGGEAASVASPVDTVDAPAGAVEGD